MNTSDRLNEIETLINELLEQAKTQTGDELFDTEAFIDDLEEERAALAIDDDWSHTDELMAYEDDYPV